MLPSSKLRMQRIWGCSIHPAKKCPWATGFSAPHGLLGLSGSSPGVETFQRLKHFLLSWFNFQMLRTWSAEDKGARRHDVGEFLFHHPPPPAPRMWRWAGMCEEKLRKQTGDNTGMWLVHPALNYRLKGKTPTAPSFLALIARALFLPFNISFLSQC